jgi:AraC-like DNA-binding protein
MTGRQPGTGAEPVRRAELVTRDMEMIADMISELYVEHRARFSCQDQSRVDASVRAVTVAGLGAGMLRYSGVDYLAQISPPDGGPLAVTVLQGGGTVTTPREHLHFTRGDVFMPPADLSHTTAMHSAGYALVQVPWPVAGGLAEEMTGLAAADLRFEAMAPVSAARQAVWTGTSAYICRELVSSGITELSSLMAQELTRLAAAAVLETFPNTAMTTAYIRGPGWVPPAAARRAAAFIDAQADHPITVPEIAEAAGVTARALQYAFRRHYGTTPTGYLRRVRLERAHRDLREADPVNGVTVAAIARKWGWANPSQFTAAYRLQFGQPPSQTLRT